MATPSNPVSRGRRGTNPSGRVDVFAASLLERAVQLHGDLVVRAIYGTFKPEIDQAIRGQLRGVKLRVPEMLRYPAEVQGQKQGQGQRVPKPAASAPPRKPAKTAPSDAGVMDMKVGDDGVYEVSDAR